MPMTYIPCLGKRLSVIGRDHCNDTFYVVKTYLLTHGYKNLSKWVTSFLKYYFLGIYFEFCALGTSLELQERRLFIR